MRGITEQALNWSGKTPVLISMFIIVVMIGGSADKYCWRREVEIEPRSQNVLEDWEMNLDTQSSVIKENTLRLVGVCRGGVWGDDSVKEDLIAECSFWILSEKKVANSRESTYQKLGTMSLSATWKLWSRSAIKEDVDGVPDFARIGRARGDRRSVRAFLSINYCGILLVCGNAQ